MKHGRGKCEKVWHGIGGEYGHGPYDDDIYYDNEKAYCGRCHAPIKKLYFSFIQGHECILPCPYGQSMNIGSNACEDCDYHFDLIELPPSQGGCYVLCEYENRNNKIERE